MGVRTVCLVAVVLTAVRALAGDPLAEAAFAEYWSKVAENAAPETVFAVDASISRSGNDAYAVKERDGKLLFTGANGRSLLYAVYDFFGRKGCRWFWDGDRLPPKGKVEIAGTDIREESRFEYRGIRYFAHRGLHRFQCEHWGIEDWKHEIDWCVKNRLNVMMLRIGMEDAWQKAFPDVVPYPDPAKRLPEALKGYDNRSLFWSLEERGRLRKALTDYARARGMDVPTDFGTMTHWYSRTPKAYLEKVKPPFMPQATKDYGEETGLVFDVRDPKWLDEYWKLTEAMLGAGYGDDRLLHTIGFGERRVFADRAANFRIKCDVNAALVRKALEKRPNAKVLLAGWDFFYSWPASEVRKLVATLDPKTTIIWDYEADATDDFPLGEDGPEDRRNFTNWGVVGKFPYVFGIFLCYEMGLDIRANYPLIEERFAKAKDDPMCKGLIFWPESAHTDTLLLKYFTENAWRSDGKPIETRLAEFCRDRYGKDAATMEAVWKDVIPASRTLGWWGNAGMILTAKGWTTNSLASIGKSPEQMPGGEALARASEVFGRLAAVDLSDPTVARDAVDLARTEADRLLLARQHRLVEKPSAANARRLVALWGLFADLLDQHADYSLNESLAKLKATALVANPDFGQVLLENCANGYCRSHQVEVVRHWYLPFAREVEAAAGRGAFDEAALMTKCEEMRQKLLATPLAELGYRGVRSPEALRKILVELKKEARSE